MSVEYMALAFKSDLPANLKLTFLALCDNADNHGRLFPSIAHLCEKTSQTERTVKAHLKALTQREIISNTDEYVGRSGRIPVRQINIDSLNRGKSCTINPIGEDKVIGENDCKQSGKMTVSNRGKSLQVIGEKSSPRNHQGTIKESSGNHHALFNDFWTQYPRKRSKPQAQVAFKKLNPDEDTMKAIIHAIMLQKESREWREDGGKYIPYPATWLNSRGWEDQLHNEVQANEKDFYINGKFNQTAYAKAKYG